ncbi:hypothetical protein SH528x_001866 [Novipirellula sp. SH528]
MSLVRAFYLFATDFRLPDVVDATMGRDIVFVRVSYSQSVNLVRV